MFPLREEAETLRLGLAMSLVSPEEVIAWADRVVVEMAEPPIEIIDVAAATRQPPDELARLLKRVPGPADLTTGAHRVLGILRARAAVGGLALGAVTNMLWVYSAEAVIPEVERLAASNFDYEYECLAYYGTPEGLGEEIGRFLAMNAAEPGTSPEPSIAADGLTAAAELYR
jgi:hypothetical protein